MQVLKYQLAHVRRQTIKLPVDAEIVAVQPQFEICTLWATTSNPEIVFDRTFVCCFTGDELTSDPDALRYLGTCQFHGGATVVHVFEELKP